MIACFSKCEAIVLAFKTYSVLFIVCVVCVCVCVVCVCECVCVCFCIKVVCVCVYVHMSNRHGSTLPQHYTCSLTPLSNPIPFPYSLFLPFHPDSLVTGRVFQTGEGNSTGTFFDVHLTLSNHNVPCITFQPVT